MSCFSVVFFCNQKTAYDMRISDWSSDVCSSDLPGRGGADAAFIAHLERQLAGGIGAASARVMVNQVITGETISLDELMRQIGRASCRERGCQYVYIQGGAGTLKNTT